MKYLCRRALAFLTALLLLLPPCARAQVIFDENAPVFPTRLEDGSFDPAAPAPFFIPALAPGGQKKTDARRDDGLFEIWFGRVNVCDAFILRCNGETMLVDGGTFSTGKAMKYFLDSLGVRGVDYVFNTHHHDDHLGMQKYLLSHGFYAGEFLTPYERNYPVADQREMERVVDDARIPYHVVHDGDTMRLGGPNGALLQFFRWSGSTNANYASVMCRITYKERSIFLMADVIAKAQKQLAVERSDIPWKSDILKAGHHGYSKQESALLRMIDPAFCVITNSRLGGDATYSQMQKLNIPVALTTQGAIYLHTDGGEDWHYTQDKSYLNDK